MKRNLLTCFGIGLLLVWSTGWANEPTAQPFQAGNMGSKNERAAKAPSFVSMTADAVIGRPVLFATTVVGTGLFIVTLPFSLLSKSVNQVGHTLIGTPGKATFERCLGCSVNDDEAKP